MLTQNSSFPESRKATMQQQPPNTKVNKVNETSKVRDKLNALTSTWGGPKKKLFIESPPKATRRSLTTSHFKTHKATRKNKRSPMPRVKSRKFQSRRPLLSNTNVKTQKRKKKRQPNIRSPETKRSERRRVHTVSTRLRQPRVLYVSSEDSDDQDDSGEDTHEKCAALEKVGGISVCLLGVNAIAIIGERLLAFILNRVPLKIHLGDLATTHTYVYPSSNLFRNSRIQSISHFQTLHTHPTHYTSLSKFSREDSACAKKRCDKNR